MALQPARPLGLAHLPSYAQQAFVSFLDLRAIGIVATVLKGKLGGCDFYCSGAEALSRVRGREVFCMKHNEI